MNGEKEAKPTVDFSYSPSLFTAQATEWLKNIEKSNGLCVLQYSDESYMDALADAISTGASVLLENIRKQLMLLLKFPCSWQKKIHLLTHS